MREILFRGKRVDNGEWVEGDLTHNFDGSIQIRVWNQMDDIDYHEIHPETVGQFTGLLDKNGKIDKNGKRIFEGDLLKLSYDGHSFNCEVKFKDGGFLVCHNNAFNGGDADMTLVGWLKHDDYSFEVTSNIHDNPQK